MKALLLAAGLGKRLRPFTAFLPKCLMPIQGKPLLDYWLASLCHAGAEEIIINLHYHADMVRKHLAGHPAEHLIQTVYETDLLDTGGTLLKNKGYFMDAAFMLIHADNLCLCNLREFIQAHQNRPAGTEITMMTFTTQDPASCGIVALNKSGVVTAFHEKVQDPPGTLANAAVYILEPTIFNFLESLAKEKIDFSNEVIPNYMGKIYTYQNTCYHRDIGNIESLENAQHAKIDNVLWIPETWSEENKLPLSKQVQSLAKSLCA